MSAAAEVGPTYEAPEYPIPGPAEPEIGMREAKGLGPEARGFETAESAPPGPQGPKPRKAAGEPATVQPDIEHLRRAWPLVLEAIKKRSAGLSAVLSEGRAESLEGDELVIRFPAGYTFQADQVSRGDNPRLLSEVLREITGKTLRITTRMAAEPAPPAADKEEDARILSKDELIRVLQQEFDAREID